MNTKAFLGCLLLSILLTSCIKELQPIRVTGITLDSTSLSLVEGETSDLVATVSPKDADNQAIIWSSTYGSVASVNNGKVNALKAGSTEIIAKSDDGGFTAKCVVTVSPKIIGVSSISLSKTELSLVEGDSETITASVKPDNATDKTVTWSSSDASIASVKDGVVTAIKGGVATITASAGDKTVSCQVNVSKKIIPVESITLNKVELSLIEGDSEILSATVKPEDATDKTVTWSSSDSSVATIDDGKVIAISEGSAVITAKAGDKSATCRVTVAKKVIPVESVELDKKELSLTEGDSETLVATVKPDDASDKTVSWRSSDVSIAKVEDGKVTAVKEGSAKITAKAGEKSATCKVTVTKKVIPVESVELDKDELELVEGDSYTLTAIVKPENATDKSVTWTSSESSVASVEDGKVIAIKEGTSVIIAQAGGKTAFCVVAVEKKSIPVESVTLNKTQIELFEGETETLVAIVWPDNATYKQVKGSTSDASIATVEDGKVTAIKEGVAIITAGVGDKIAVTAVIVKKDGAVGDVCSKMDDFTFKRYCYDNFDVDHNGRVSKDEAEAVKVINVASCNIASLNGIEYFSNLEKLDCSFNSLTFLDVSQNDKLVSLNCSMNPTLRDIWYGDNISLLDLEFASEGLTSIISKGNASIEGKWGLKRISYYDYYIDDSFDPEEDYYCEIDEYDPFKPSTDEDCFFNISKGYKSYVFSNAGYWDTYSHRWRSESVEVAVDEASFPIDGLNYFLELIGCEGNLKNETVFALITPDYLSFELIEVDEDPWYVDNVDYVIEHSRFIFRRLN